MRLTKATTAVLALPVLAGCLLTGCGNAAPAPAPSATETVNALPAGVTQPTAVPTDVPNDANVRQNVKITDCSSADGGWAAKGTANNPGNKAVDYTITVFFTTDQATVLHTAQTKVAVEPGKSADWNITEKFPTTPKTLCVLRGVSTK
ncbi:hypothetical protein [Arthrobacter bambusae]|uniref:Secreted protein n=1 Tax=Arthrobacter bambusae TaxID=1338426 RepID=A0AAP5DXG2_9MICC|nr:hypothetical protein [Arthrobacter bambusae]MDP9904635.1 hypothetical protein [Arthrobacter bambusae]MDP9904656.1 hypothetical protein [Arthrobacter bambusae]MDQ0129451.1 hypothetical protein [Arthrobacter bambusae]MDQ0129472.1 hypothetical protein [Arthrobacter bambusae]MDQ0180915.1 hypothetical protein [Arthrobacter bambusae]